MNQILYTKDFENINNYSYNIDFFSNYKIKKKRNLKFTFFLPTFTILPLLLVSINIYAYVKKENISNNTDITDNVLSASEINQEVDNEDEILEEIPLIVNNDIEDIESNTENDTNINNNSNISTTYQTSNYDVIATLSIPSLGIEYPVLSSTSTELLKVALNKYWGADPNQVGNMVIVGHNYRNTTFFSKLPTIQIGNIIKITDTSGKTLDYTVYETNVIDPYDNSCTSQLTDGHTEITLITCYNNGKQRFVAKARAI